MEIVRRRVVEGGGFVALRKAVVTLLEGVSGVLERVPSLFRRDVRRFRVMW
jgi:hypothetical protein